MTVDALSLKKSTLQVESLPGNKYKFAYNHLSGLSVGTIDINKDR